VTEAVLLDRLAGVPRFAKFDQHDLAELPQRGSIVETEAGRTVIRQGSKPTPYVVLVLMTNVAVDRL
jgi:hypothetical protein